MLKKYLLQALPMILSLIMLMGSTETRVARAAFFGRTLFFPLVHSLKAIESNASLRQENFSLRSQLTESTLHNLELQNELMQYHEVESVAFSSEDMEFTLAEVIGFSGQFYERNLIVNKGRMQGITVGLGVISGRGIVGKIVSVTDTYSIILPYSNPRFQVPVMDQRTGVQGILQSDISGVISMNMVKMGSEIATGDTIVTSNLSRLYPKGFPIGTISRLRESTDNLFISAELSPYTLVENLEHVFILTKRKDL